MAQFKNEKQRRALYDAGMNDAEIGRAESVAKRTIKSWRDNRNLPVNYEYTGLSADMRAARILLYSLGYGDQYIAKLQGVHSASVCRWRIYHGLASNKPIGGRRAKDVDVGPIMLKRIKRALPAYLSPADRDDAAGNLFVAVMSGAIPIDEIEKRAKTFGNKVINDYASKWGARSLDEEIGEEGDGFTMMDTLVDERSSSWLEEMGATAW